MEKTFIYRHRNQNGKYELRQLRFTHLVVDFTTHFIDNMIHNSFPLKYAEAEVVGIGTFAKEMHYTSYKKPCGSLDLHLDEVYESVEDALKPQYKGYNRMVNGCFYFNGCISPRWLINDNFYDKLPSFAQVTKSSIYSPLTTWIWDGCQPKQVDIMVYHDLIDGTNTCRQCDGVPSWCDCATLRSFYATREECVNANHVEVFTF